MNMLLGEGEADAMLKQKLDSHDWWIIPLASDLARDVSALIERRFYLGEPGANADFEILLGHVPLETFAEAGVAVTSISFAHKRRMSREALIELLVETGARRELVQRVGEQDILWFMANHTDGNGGNGARH